MGFSTRETMSGYHDLVDEPGRRPFEFRVEWGPERLRDWLNPTSERFLWQPLRGEVLVGGLCDWTPCTGTLSLEYFTSRRIRYSFDFEVDGKTYRYGGDKVGIALWNLPVSHMTCTGAIRELDTGRLVSTAVCWFKLRDLPKLVASVRWRRDSAPR